MPHKYAGECLCLRGPRLVTWPLASAVDRFAGLFARCSAAPPVYALVRIHADSCAYNSYCPACVGCMTAAQTSTGKQLLLMLMLMLLLPQLQMVDHTSTPSVAHPLDDFPCVRSKVDSCMYHLGSQCFLDAVTATFCYC